MNEKKSYTVVNSEGLICKNVYCQPSRINRFINEGETAHLGNYNRIHFKFENGEFVELSEVEKVPLTITTINSNQTGKTKVNRHGLKLLQDEFTDLNLTFDEAKGVLDLSAGDARARIKSKGEFMNDEYDLLHSDVIKYRDTNGVDVGDFLSCHAVNRELSVEQIAVAVEEQVSNYRNSLLQITTYRVQGIRALELATDNYYKVAKTFIDLLDAF